MLKMSGGTVVITIVTIATISLLWIQGESRQLTSVTSAVLQSLCPATSIVILANM